jgi:hypothetical protein
VVFHGRLKDRFQVDRHRVVTGRDHVLMMNVGAGKAMKESQPGSGTPKKARAALGIGAPCVRDELAPAVAVSRDCAHRPKLDRGSGLVQSCDQIVPGSLDAQVLRLVQDPCAILEPDAENRASTVVRIGKVAFDPGDHASGVDLQDIAADGREVGIETRDEFA